MVRWRRTNARRWPAAAAAVIVAAVGAVSVPVTAAASGEGRGIYVATWGRDAWPGTFERPFATVVRAQQAVRSLTAGMSTDIVVSLRGGTYQLTAPLALSAAAGDSGRNGHRVIYQPYGYGTPGREQVTVSGGRGVSGWRAAPGLPGVWQADVGSLHTRQLYVNGVRAPKAAAGGLPGEVTQVESGYRTDSVLPQSWRNPAGIEFEYTFPIYSDARCGVAGISGDATGTTITMREPCWSMAKALYEEPLPGEEPEPLGPPTRVTNSPSFLRTAGGWALDRSRPGHHLLYYRPRAGEDMRRVSVVAPVLENLVSGTGSPGAALHDISLRGLTFAYATWLAPDDPGGFVSSWSMYKRPGVATWLTVPGTVTFHASRRIALADNRFVHLGAQGVEISRGSSDTTVERNEFTDLSDGGILLGVTLPDTRGISRGNRIGDNWVHRIGVENSGAAAVWNTASQRTTIEHNLIEDVPYMGILSGRDPDVPGATGGNRIVGNRVVNAMRRTGDGGGIYIRGAQGTSYADGLLVSGNLVTGARLEQEAIFNAGVYTDDTANWITVRGNVVYDYLASIGGCDEPGAPVDHVRFQGNFWDDAVPAWVDRLAIPGGWPCGAPHRVSFRDNTALRPDDPERACRAEPACAAVLATSGRR